MMLRIQPLALACCFLQATGLPLKAYTVLIDFGGNAVTLGSGPANDPVRYWNNVTNGIGTSSEGNLPNLVTTTNVKMGLGLQIVEAFNGNNAVASTAFPGMPTNATGDSLFGNGGTHGTLTNVLPEFYFYGLDPSKRYNFGVFASRTSAGGDNREGIYTFTGSTVASTSLNASDNLSNMAYVYDLAPDENGQIRVKMTVSPNNNNVNRYIYMNFMQIQEVPEPTAAGLLLSGTLALMFKRRR